MAERKRPAKGMPWDSLAHRKADALIELASDYTDVKRSGRPIFEIVNIHDPNATSFGAEVAGIPLAPEQVVALLPQALVRDCEVDENGLAVTKKRPRKGIPRDVERHVRRRDLHCRTAGCTNPAHEIHHMYPVSEFGDTTDVHKLAGVCDPDHRMLVPNGPYWLIGDAEQPDGLRMVHRDDLPPDHPDHPGRRPRAGPSP